MPAKTSARALLFLSFLLGSVPTFGADLELACIGSFTVGPERQSPPTEFTIEFTFASGRVTILAPEFLQFGELALFVANVGKADATSYTLDASSEQVPTMTPTEVTGIISRTGGEATLVIKDEAVIATLDGTCQSKKARF